MELFSFEREFVGKKCINLTKIYFRALFIYFASLQLGIERMAEK